MYRDPGDFCNPSFSESSVTSVTPMSENVVLRGWGCIERTFSHRWIFSNNLPDVNSSDQCCAFAWQAFAVPGAAEGWGCIFEV